MADYPNPPDDDFATTDLSPMLKRAQQIVRDVAAVSCYLPMSEAEFLGRPHPKTVAHTAAVVERVQALTPPSLVKLDRGEALVAQVVIWRRLELGGQAPGDQQWDAALAYVRDLADRYIEATS